MNFPNLIPLIINKSVDLTQSSFFRLCDFKLFPFYEKAGKNCPCGFVGVSSFSGNQYAGNYLLPGSG